MSQNQAINVIAVVDARAAFTNIFLNFNLFRK